MCPETLSVTHTCSHTHYEAQGCGNGTLQHILYPVFWSCRAVWRQEHAWKQDHPFMGLSWRDCFEEINVGIVLVLCLSWIRHSKCQNCIQKAESYDLPFHRRAVCSTFWERGASHLYHLQLQSFLRLVIFLPAAIFFYKGKSGEQITLHPTKKKQNTQPTKTKDSQWFCKVLFWCDVDKTIWCDGALERSHENFIRFV